MRAMSILRNAGPSDVEKKMVTVCPIREIGVKLPTSPASQFVVHRKHRLIGPLVRGGITVKPVGTKILRYERREQAAAAAKRGSRADARNGKTALEHETRRTIDRCSQSLPQLASCKASLPPRGDKAETATLNQTGCRRDVTPCNHVNRAAERVGAKNGRPGTVQYLDTLDRIERNGNIAVVVAGLCVVQPNPIDEHQHLTEVGSTNRKVRLDSAFAACTNVHRSGQPQHICNAVDG